MMGDARSPVLIYGAGGFGREVVSWLRTDAICGFEPVGFIDDVVTAIGQDQATGLAVGPLDDVARIHKGVGVLIALGSGASRKAAAERAGRAGLKVETFVHSSVVFGERIVIGEGCLIMPGTIMTCDIRIGKLVVVNCSCNIGHDVEIESYSTLLGNNALNGNVRIGELTTIGSRATVLPGKRIGSRSTVGIGSVVIKSVNDDTTVFGVPAKILTVAR